MSRASWKAGQFASMSAHDRESALYSGLFSGTHRFVPTSNKPSGRSQSKTNPSDNKQAPRTEPDRDDKADDDLSTVPVGSDTVSLVPDSVNGDDISGRTQAEDDNKNNNAGNDDDFGLATLRALIAKDKEDEDAVNRSFEVKLGSEIQGHGVVLDDMEFPVIVGDGDQGIGTLPPAPATLTMNNTMQAPDEPPIVHKTLTLTHLQLDTLQNMVLKSGALQYAYNRRGVERPSVDKYKPHYDRKQSLVPFDDPLEDYYSNSIRMPVERVRQQFRAVRELAQWYSHPEFASALTEFLGLLEALICKLDANGYATRSDTRLCWGALFANTMHQVSMVRALKAIRAADRLQDAQVWPRAAAVGASNRKLTDAVLYFKQNV